MISDIFDTNIMQWWHLYGNCNVWYVIGYICNMKYESYHLQSLVDYTISDIQCKYANDINCLEQWGDIWSINNIMQIEINCLEVVIAISSYRFMLAL